MRIPALLLLSGALGACQADASDPSSPPHASSATGASEVASTLGGDMLPSAAEVERGRRSGRWRDTAPVDTTGRAAAQRSNEETLDGIDQMAADTTAWSGQLQLPLGGDVAGPSVLQAQVLLNRAGFSPGVLDGQWSDSTERAMAWFQSAMGLRSTGILNRATLRALVTRAGAPRQLVVTHILTGEDVEGPFAPLPTDLSEKAALDRLGYVSLGEKLGERFHATPALLTRLNDGEIDSSLWT